MTDIIFINFLWSSGNSINCFCGFFMQNDNFFRSVFWALRSFILVKDGIAMNLKCADPVMRRGDKIRVRTSICHPSHDGVYAFQEIYWILRCSQNKFEKLNHINIMPSLFFISSNSLRYF